MDNTPIEENRWGNRFEMNLAADLLMTDGNASEVTVRSASLSGALIDTPLRPPPMSRVLLKLRKAAGPTLNACVVRVDPRGVALEWVDPPTGSVSALLSSRFFTRTRPAHGGRGHPNDA